MEAKLSLRVESLETAMVQVKQHQYEHECQIETLALAVNHLGDEIKRLDRNMNRRFEHVESTLLLICDALAIKY